MAKTITFTRKHFRIKRDKRTGMLTYIYRPVYHDPHMQCRYHLLAEVGEPYQPAIKEELKRRKWEITSGDAPPPIHWANYVK